jgi:hypothetical protein
LLYPSAPHEYGIWVNATQDGLNVLNRISELKGGDWGKNYAQFNEAAIDFRAKYGFEPQEVDWFLTYIGFYVEAEENRFRISEEALDTNDAVITGDRKNELLFLSILRQDCCSGGLLT